MTGTQAAVARHRGPLLLIAILVTLAGGLAVAFLLIDRATERANYAVEEANLRGEAVTVLAGDVRALRAQVEAEGATPVAPDPTTAVEDLPDRAEVPVPIPGPRGATGATGKPGEPGKNGTNGSPGTTGSPGATGPTGPVGPTGPQGEQGPPGPAGPAGQDGTDGADGRDGQDGQTCPDGYTLQPPDYDPDALVCRRNSTPTDDQPGDANGTQALALDPQRRQYT